MANPCRCSPENRERAKTVDWQPDMCRTCGGDIPEPEEQIEPQ